MTQSYAQILGLHFALTWFMTGLVWYTQVVHYRLFSRVDRASFPTYHQENIRLTSFVVAPAMLLELGSAIFLLYLVRPPEKDGWLFAINFALLLAIWFVTAFLQVPEHKRLAEGFDEATFSAVVKSNWIRVALWSVRAFLLFILVAAKLTLTSPPTGTSTEQNSRPPLTLDD